MSSSNILDKDIEAYKELLKDLDYVEKNLPNMYLNDKNTIKLNNFEYSSYGRFTYNNPPISIRGYNSMDFSFNVDKDVYLSKKDFLDNLRSIFQEKGKNIEFEKHFIKLYKELHSIGIPINIGKDEFFKFMKERFYIAFTKYKNLFIDIADILRTAYYDLKKEIEPLLRKYKIDTNEIFKSILESTINLNSIFFYDNGNLFIDVVPYYIDINLDIDSIINKLYSSDAKESKGIDFRFYIGNIASKIILEDLIPKLKELSEKYGITSDIDLDSGFYTYMIYTHVIPNNEYLSETVLSHDIYDDFSELFREHPSYKRKYPYLYKLLNLGKGSVYDKIIKKYKPINEDEYMLYSITHNIFLSKIYKELAQGILNQLEEVKMRNRKRRYNINDLFM